MRAAVERSKHARFQARDQQIGIRGMLPQTMHRSPRQAIHNPAPVRTVVLTYKDIRMIVVVEMPVYRDIHARDGVLRGGDAADIQPRRKSNEVTAKIRPLPASIASNLDRAVVGAGVKHVLIERRFRNGGEGGEIGLPVMAGKRALGNGAAHRLKLFAVDIGGKVGADGAPGDAAVIGAEQHVRAGVDGVGIEAGNDQRGGPIPAVAGLRTVLGLHRAHGLAFHVLQVQPRGGAVLRTHQDGTIVLEDGLHAIAAADIESVLKGNTIGHFRGAGGTPVPVVLQAAADQIRLAIVDRDVIELPDGQIDAEEP